MHSQFLKFLFFREHGLGMSPVEFRSRMEFLETVDYSVGTARRHFVCSNNIGIVSAGVVKDDLPSRLMRKNVVTME